MRYASRVLIHSQRLVMAGALLVLSGCGGVSAKVQEAQDLQIKQLYKEATTDPPNMSPKAAQRRKERVEMDFGVPSGTMQEEAK